MVTAVGLRLHDDSPLRPLLRYERDQSREVLEQWLIPAL